MFVGHYGVSFAAKRMAPKVPLWVLFMAVQLLDVIWAPLVLLGIEKARIVPGITASNPLDLYYMPYTHSLVAAVLWSAAAFAGLLLLPGRNHLRLAATVVAVAVFSHWVLDFVVHRPDLPLYDDSAKVGLGLWNRPILAFALEAGLLFGGIGLYFKGAPGRKWGVMIFGLVMLAVQAWVFFGPPPPSARAAAVTALGSYIAFAIAIQWLELRRSAALPGAGRS